MCIPSFRSSMYYGMCLLQVYQQCLFKDSAFVYFLQVEEIGDEFNIREYTFSTQNFRYTTDFLLPVIILSLRDPLYITKLIIENIIFPPFLLSTFPDIFLCITAGFLSNSIPFPFSATSKMRLSS